MHWYVRKNFPKHWIRTSEILPWDRTSYLTQAFLPRLARGATYIGCIGTHAHDRQVMSLLCLSDGIRYNCILAYSGTSGSLFKIKKNSGEQEK